MAGLYVVTLLVDLGGSVVVPGIMKVAFAVAGISSLGLGITAYADRAD
jgi:hypothetical protein